MKVTYRLFEEDDEHCSVTEFDDEIFDDYDGYNTDEEGLFEHEGYLVSEPWDV